MGIPRQQPSVHIAFISPLSLHSPVRFTFTFKSAIFPISSSLLLLLLRVDPQGGAAPGLPRGEPHRAAHLLVGLLQCELVHRPLALHAHQGPRLQRLPVQRPSRRLVDGHRHLAAEARGVRRPHLRVLQLPHHHQLLGCGQPREKLSVALHRS